MFLVRVRLGSSPKVFKSKIDLILEASQLSETFDSTDRNDLCNGTRKHIRLTGKDDFKLAGTEKKPTTIHTHTLHGCLELH